MDSDQNPELERLETPRRSRGRRQSRSGPQAHTGESQLRNRQQKPRPRSTSSSSSEGEAESLLVEHRKDERIIDPGHVIRVKLLAESLSSLGTSAKEPWVPAPARTTRPRSAVISGDQPKSKMASAVASPLKSHQAGGDGASSRQQPRNNKSKSNLHRCRGKQLLAVSKDNLEKADAVSTSQRLTLTGYKLQSKDSLVDVAACLNARREDVLRLWQQNISNSSLVEDVEKANQLAIEAGRDVAELRQSIHDLQQKPSLTPQDSEALNQLRNRILVKLEQFEETHAQIQLNLARLGKNANAMSKSTVSAAANLAKSNRASQTSIPETKAKAAAVAADLARSKLKNSSNTSLIYIANKSEQFSDDEVNSPSETEEEMMNNMKVKSKSVLCPPPLPEDEEEDKDEDEEYEVHETNLHHHVHVLRDLRHVQVPVPVKKAQSKARSLDRISEERSRSKSSSVRIKTKHQPSASFEPELNNVRKKYSRDMPGADEEEDKRQYLTTSSTTSEEFPAHETEEGQGQHREDPYRPSSSDNEELRAPQRRREASAPAVDPSRDPDSDTDLNYYRHKLEKLHRKLLEQDTKYELLSRDVQKFESQSGFDLMLFKATVASRLEELEPYPELLAATEKRLAETLQGKFVLEAELQAKMKELSSAKNEIEKLIQQANDSKIQNQAVETKYEHLTRKVGKYRRVNEESSQRIASLQQELDGIRRQAPPPPDKVGTQCHHAKAAIYEDRIAELKRELKKERRNVVLLRESKNSLTTRMAHRLQQLMIALEDSRARNRELVKQLRLIQSSYHELFPSVQVAAVPVPRSTPRTSTFGAATVADIRRKLEDLCFDQEQDHDHKGKSKSKIKAKTGTSRRFKKGIGIGKGRRPRLSTKLEFDESIHNDLRGNPDEDVDEQSKSNSNSDSDE